MSTKAIYVSNESDVAEAVRQAMKAAVEIGFGTVQSHYIATAASELAANLLIHAGGGVLTLLQLVEPSGIELMTIDGGPGIADIGKALQNGYSTARGLGCGLPDVQRLMDELTIVSRPGEQTVIRAQKWL